MSSRLLPLAVLLLVSGAVPASAAPPLEEALLRAWSQRYASLTRTAGSTLAERPSGYVRELFLLEHELVQMLVCVEQAPDLPDASRLALSSSLRARFAQLQWGYRTVLDVMRTRVEHRFPGTSGSSQPQPRRMADGEAQDLYEPSYKSSRPLTAAARRRRYLALREEHRAEHGVDRPYQALDRRALDDLASGELLEWVATPGGHVRVTRDAKHAVVAGGRPVASAGGLKVFWAERGGRRAALAVLSNWSGTYQPDFASAEPTMLARLVRLGIPRDRIVLSPAMPVSSKVYEVLLRAEGASDDEARARAASLEQAAEQHALAERETWARALAHATRARWRSVATEGRAHSAPRASRREALALPGTPGRHGAARATARPSASSGARVGQGAAVRR